MSRLADLILASCVLVAIVAGAVGVVFCIVMLIHTGLQQW